MDGWMDEILSCAELPYIILGFRDLSCMAMSSIPDAGFTCSLCFSTSPRGVQNLAARYVSTTYLTNAFFNSFWLSASGCQEGHAPLYGGRDRGPQGSKPRAKGLSRRRW
eukprot:scaffold393887_cov19-Prasinocladus_malaysianus.AAC.1